MSLNDFESFKKLLLSVGVPVFHDKAMGVKPPYIRWSQTTQLREYAGDKTAHKGWRVAVDYFTLDEYDEVADFLEAALENGGIPISDCERITEEETGYIHYAYTVEVFDLG